MPTCFRTANIRGEVPFFYSSILDDAMAFDAAIAMNLTVRKFDLPDERNC